MFLLWFYISILSYIEQFVNKKDAPYKNRKHLFQVYKLYKEVITYLKYKLPEIRGQILPYILYNHNI